MKRSKTWLISFVCCLALIGFTISFLTAKAQDNYELESSRQLNNASLRGTYAGILSGTLINGNISTPTAVSYIQRANGNGRIEGKAQVNINGQLFPDVDYAGTYTVKPNGAISIDLVPSNGPLAGVHLLSEGAATEIERGQILEHRDVLHTGSVITTVVKRIKPGW